jgi:hypothetical protein
VQKSSFWSKTKDKESAPVVEDTRRVDELSQQLAEHRAALGLQAKEVEQLKLQLAMTTKLFEQGTRSITDMKNLLLIVSSEASLLRTFSLRVCGIPCCQNAWGQPFQRGSSSSESFWKGIVRARKMLIAWSICKNPFGVIAGSLSYESVCIYCSLRSQKRHPWIVAQLLILTQVETVSANQLYKSSRVPRLRRLAIQAGSGLQLRVNGDDC